VLIAGLSLVRQTGVPSWRTIWAEDALLLSGATQVSSITREIAGYVVLLPRLVALLSVPLPASSFAAELAVGAALVDAALAVSVWWFARSLIPSGILRGVLVLAVVLHPVMLTEDLANGVNTIWPLLFACFWALLFWPRRRTSAIAAGAVCALAALSTPLAALYLPLAGFLLWKRRDPLTRLVFLVFVIAITVQGLFVVTGAGAGTSGSNLVADLPRLFGVRVLASSLVGETFLVDHWRLIHSWIGIAALTVWLVLLILVVLYARGERLLLGCLAILYSAVMFVVPVWQRGTVLLRSTAQMFNGAEARYAGFSILLLLSGAFILISALRVRQRVVSAITLVVALQFAIVSAPGFRGTNERSAGPAWNVQLELARRTCSRRQVRTIDIPTTPAPSWRTSLACERIR